MYNAHRGMGPPGQAPPGTRLAELLEQVRAEFETQAGRSNEHEHQRKHIADLIVVRSNGGMEHHSRARDLEIPLALGA
jgi:glucose repression regulatory protein TUP1